MAAERENAKSTKYPGLVCADSRTLLFVEESLEEAKTDARKVGFPNGVMFLPDNLDELFPNMEELYCSTEYLVELPECAKNLKQLKNIHVHHTVDLSPFLLHWPNMEYCESIVDPRAQQGIWLKWVVPLASARIKQLAAVVEKMEATIAAQNARIEKMEATIATQNARIEKLEAAVKD